MAGPWKRLRSNPLLVHEWARTRSLWRILGAVIAILLVLVGILAVGGGVWISQQKAGSQALSSAVGLLLILVVTLSCGSGLVWLVTIAAMPTLAASAMNRMRASGMGELLALTLIGGRQTVDAILVRTLLRYPLWLLAVMLLPFSTLASLFSTVFNSASLFGFMAEGSGPRIPNLQWVLAGAVALVVLAALTIIVQLFSAMEIGLAAGAMMRTQGAAIAVTFGLLVVLYWMVPSTCNAIASFATLSAATGGFGDGPARNGSMLILVAGTAGMQLLTLIYYLAIFYMTRGLAGRRLEQPVEE